MARSFGESFKRVDPIINQDILTERVIGSDGNRKVEIQALDSENIFEPMDPNKARIKINGELPGVKLR